jgi:hypothetical protein
MMSRSMGRADTARRITALAIVLANAPGQVVAQDVVTIRDEPSCKGCKINLVTLFTISDDAIPTNALPRGVSARDSRGRWLVHMMDHSYGVFSSEGKYITAIGREGKGPGEFMNPGPAVFAPGDTLYVFDGSLRRAIIFDPAGAVVRTFSIPSQINLGHGAVFLTPSRLVVNLPLAMSPPFTGVKYHLADVTTGEITGSFGKTDDPAQNMGTRRFRTLARASESSFWSVTMAEYRVERWNALSLQCEAVFIRESAWFSPPTQAELQRDFRRPVPRVSDIRVDDQERLWVLASVPREGWEKLFYGPDSATYRKNPSALQQSVIEVIDVKTRRVLARQSFSQIFENLTDDREGVYVYTFTPDEAAALTIFRLELQGVPKSGK